MAEKKCRTWSWLVARALARSALRASRGRQTAKGQRAKSAAITEALGDGDAIGGSAPSKIARTLATLFFGSLQIKWPIVRLVWYGQ